MGAELGQLQARRSRDSACQRREESWLTQRRCVTQERLQRCLAHCQDRAADVVRDDPNAQDKAQAVMETCVGECARHSTAEVPKMLARMFKAHKP